MNHRARVSFTICLVLSVVTTLCASSSAGAEAGATARAEQHFTQANELRKAEDYDAAIAEYEKAMAASPKGELAQDAQYWIGQAHLEAGRLDAAQSAFQTILDEYPNSKVIASTKQMLERVQQAKRDESLFEAVKTGDVGHLESLIAKGIDVNAEDPNGVPLLHLAAQAGHADVVALLLKHEAEVNAEYERSGTTPLHAAALRGHTAVAELLINAGAHGAHLNAHARWGHTPMEYAANGGHKEMVELLLARGADIEAGDDWNRTPLLGAVPNNHPEIVKLLLDRGANVEARLRSDGATALHMAARQGYVEVAELLLRAGAYVDSTDYNGRTPFIRAIEAGHTEMVGLLLGEGARPWTRHAGIGPIGEAMKSGQKEMVQFLIDQDFDHSPVHVAAFSGDLDAVKRYLAGGGDIDAYSPSWLTLLGCAILGGHVAEAEFLIDEGADINQKDGENVTVLTRALWGKQLEIAKTLLAKGAYVTKDQGGDDVIGPAVRTADKGIIETVLARGADINAKSTYRGPYPPDYKFDTGWTALHSACWRTNPRWRGDYEMRKAVVEQLVARGADVNAKTKNGRTPMSLLNWPGDDHNRELIELLRKHGATE